MSRAPRVAESAIVALVGVLLGGAAGSFVGLGLITAGVAGVNGALSGWRGVYDWRRPAGTAAFVLDSSWSLPMTTAGLFANAVGLVQRDSGFVVDLSRRQNRHVYRRGFTPRRGFATTVGNVVGGAGAIENPRRRRLVTDHEDVHCWQARGLGPLYPVLYSGWTMLGGAAGMVIWMTRRRDEQFGDVVESTAYYLNPLEWWAYSRDDHWPPSGKIAGLGWTRPCCRPLAAVRAER